ncbi:MAG: YceI family protein [Chloroflexi bacterium]|nr:MAG: YceI family protein [Chloroflexota bacterium]TME01416.1 MAG: YceI family protein [Chloroflexota bacterium]TME38950.1 MAG: YceI family protein [Chloroflexota bacterium]TME53691.1 MAG: YceI family protein [Chloroflexota bacterium]
MAVGSMELVRVVNGRLVPAAGVWEFDPGHTEAAFEGRHLMVTRIRGRFTRIEGRLLMADLPEESVAELKIDSASVDSGFRDRDDHLKSSDWFDVERYPTIVFRSGELNHVTGNHWKAKGELTIKAITRPIELDVEFAGAVTDPWGNSKIGAVVTATVDRHAWDLRWNMPLDAGGVVVGTPIQLTVNVEAVFRGALP